MYTPRDNWEFFFKVVGLLVAIFGVVTYFADKHADRSLARSDNAFELIETYEAGNVLAARQKLLGFWVRNEEAVTAFSNTKPSERAYRGFILAAIASGPNQNGIYEAIEQQVSFFDRVELCLEHGVCNSEMIIGHFCGIALGVQSRYRPVIEDRNTRASANLMGQGLGRFVQRCET